MNDNEIVQILQKANEAIETLQGAYEVMSALADVRKEEIESLQAQLAEAQRRERAAVEDLNLTANCDVCKHYDADEISCAKPTVDSYSCFEWRGPQEADHAE